MPVTIDLALPLIVRQIALYQTVLGTTASNLETWSTTITNQKNKALADWSGGAADAFSTAATCAADWTSEFSKTTKTFADAVQVFYDSATGIKGRLDDLKDRALLGGLIVNGDTVSVPPPQTFLSPPDTPPSPGEVEANAEHQAKVELFNTLSRERDEDFSSLYEAHVRFQLACKAVKPPGSIEAGDRSKDVWGNFQTIAGMVGTGGDLSKLTIYLIMGHWGRFAPRSPNGRFLPITPETLASFAKEDIKNWVRLPKTGDWWNSFAERTPAVLKALKGVEIIGWAITAASAVNDARTQWDLDSHDPTLDGWEKTLRAGAAIVADEGAPVLGGLITSLAGAGLGGLIASETGPGAIVGGIIGGIAGGIVGGGIGDGLHDTFHGWIDGIRW